MGSVHFSLSLLASYILLSIEFSMCFSSLVVLDETFFLLAAGDWLLSYGGTGCDWQPRELSNRTQDD